MIIKEKSYQKIITFWILSTISLIFFMIIVGGLTRLTNSGLSITEWELFQGILPPLNIDEWNNYFYLYKQIPQYEFINKDMTLSEFKVIFYWEYFHRLLGRLIGIFFLIPLIYFTYKKIFNQKTLKVFYFVFLLILLQGLIGWYMVQSGLVNDITVSHYRLSLHLFGAFLIISILFWQYLNLKNLTIKLFFNKENLILKLLFLMILIQICLGAFVSGLDAGLIYQTWPKMNSSFFPDDIILKNYNLLSIFNDQSFVQFFHRVFAYIISFYVLYIGVKLYIIEKKKYLSSYILILAILLLQVVLGILTLISGLSLYLASLHQITSVILVFTVLNINHKFA